MLLILSDKGDMSTNDVIDWLIQFNVPHIRLNGDESSEIELFTENDSSKSTFLIKTKNHCFSLKEITSFWYRRGGIPQFKIPASSIDQAFDKEVSGKIKTYLNLESQALYSFIHSLLDKIPNKIGSSKTAGVNKLHVLDKAQEFGLSVPRWCVSMKTKESIGFANRVGGEVITKGVWESLIVSAETSGYSTYTEQINLSKLNTLPESHFPSMLQEKVNKKYEVRSFYLLGRFWSMAIFSQNDPQTSVDFRKYNDDNPNRNVPFKLPVATEKKLKKLMDFFNLETGSIDILVDEENHFIFLEINPVGQFGMTSSPCNYYLEKEIAYHFYLQNQTPVP